MKLTALLISALTALSGCGPTFSAEALEDHGGAGADEAGSGGTGSHAGASAAGSGGTAAAAGLGVGGSAGAATGGAPQAGTAAVPAGSAGEAPAGAGGAPEGGAGQGGEAGGGAPVPSCTPEEAIARSMATIQTEFQWDGYSYVGERVGEEPLCSTSAGGTCSITEIFEFSASTISANVQCAGVEIIEGACGMETSCGTLRGPFRLVAIRYTPEPSGDGWRFVGAERTALRASTTGSCHLVQDGEALLWQAGADVFLGRDYPC